MRPLVALLIIGSSFTPYAGAVCQAPTPRLVCAEYFKSKAVVTAKLIRAKTIIGKDGFVTANIYYMQTAKLLRGTIAPEFEVYEGNDSGRAAFDWKLGKSFLLFLLPSDETKSGAWKLDSCGNSGPAEQRESAVVQIERIAQRRGGMIEVAVGGNWISYSPVVKDARIMVQGGAQHRYSAVTDDAGSAEIYVPAGQYSVSLAASESFVPFDLTYDNPERVTIQNGSCAQIQFVRSQE